MRHFLLTILLSCVVSICFSQKIKGVITDSSGKVLPYASVFVKGTNKGTHSNNDGKYSLKLGNGDYVLVCQYVGYQKQERTISVNNNDHDIDFRLSVQEMTLSEVVLNNTEDPAYQIIRNAINKRTYHLGQLDKFSCEVYTKGQMSVRDYPKKILGRKVDFEDGDTSKKKMLYLSETISKYSADKPDKVKIEVISSKVSGQSDGFGLSAPQFFSFYENSVMIGNNLNPRGFISPIAENALNYYRYKLEGTYFEDGREICHIKVMPKRKFEPLFAGYIDIVADDWRIHSVKLLLTKSSQMELLDTLRIEQLYRPVTKDVWFISSQVMYPTIKMFGFDGYGNFVNIYSEFNIDPVFTKRSFNNTVIKYVDSANKKTDEYWEKTRPIPLVEEEVKDYRQKDSLQKVRKDPRYLDSLDKRRNKVSMTSIVLVGQTFFNSKKRTSLGFSSLIESVSFNPAEGWVFSPSVTYFKRLDTASVSGRPHLFITPTLRYGFGNHHFNPYLTVFYSYGNKYQKSLRVSGGQRVFQFNNNSPIGERGNTISSLWSEKNRIKSYEAIYFRASYRQGVGDGFSWTAAIQYQDRKPIDNITDYTWRDKSDRAYTPNYPSEIMLSNIKRHQVFMALLGITFQPGARYVELPDRKMNIGSKYPVFNLQYIHAFKNVFGSDENFSKWKLSITDGINLKLAGRFRYRIGFGGFLDTGHVEVPDYNHFNGNLSKLATEYLNSFQLLPIYRFSNLSKFYALAHIEHNFNGFLTNKIPGIRNLNLYLVTGANGFYIDKDKNYVEVFAGIDNIFKQVRVDFVQGFLDGRKFQCGIRVGVKIGGGVRGDDWP